ncbi:MAG: TonB-dependent receptor [Nostoc sp.]
MEVILETPVGTQLQVTNRSAGNNFIVDVSGGQLRLTDGNAFTFRSDKPVAGITQVTVTNIDANTVRVTVVGEKALPTVELFDDDAGLVFAVATTATAMQPPQTPQTEEKPAPSTPQQTPSTQGDEPIELVVTGEQDGYSVPNSSTATRTDTPLRDIPQSIQVVPRQVLEDRNVRSLDQAIETVSGVVQTASTFAGELSGGKIIRGFLQYGNFRNGFQDVGYFGLTPIGTIEQVEVLKGPASVLFGQVEPGGIINIITRQPLSQPYYNLAFEAGSYGFYQPSIDLSGPLTKDNTLLYRFIASYQGAKSYQDFANTEQTTIAPSITLNLGDRTSLNLYYEYAHLLANPPNAPIALLSNGSFTPRSFYTGYPDLNLLKVTTQKFGYTLNHKFSDNWQIRNNIAISLDDIKRDNRAYAGGLEGDRFLTGFTVYGEDSGYEFNNYFGQIDLLGKFNTGSITHQLLVGFDANRLVVPSEPGVFSNDVPPLNLFNPNYNVPRPNFEFSFQASIGTTQSYGVYLQDQVAFSNSLKLLIGGRYDWISSENNTFGDGIDPVVENNGAFSPRIGLLYQPNNTVSLYASYSREKEI